MSRKSFISGAFILMAAGFAVRLLGFIYRIYLSNLIGAEGMGLFQLIFPVYSLVILTITSGISIAVSKLTAEEFARSNFSNLRRITRLAFLLTVVSALIVSAAMYLEADFIVKTILKDERTRYALLLLIPCIPVISAASVLKGYFYGIQDVTPTAVSMIAEQIVRISLVMLTAGYFLRLGLEYACALATVGMVAGEMSNLAVVFLYYRKRRLIAGGKPSGLMRKRKALGKLMKISVPVSFNRFITSGMSAVENIMIPRMLAAGGLSYQLSIETYGKLTGMAMPLLFFPSLVTASLATTLVPAISEALSLRNYRSLNRRISKSVQISFIIGFIFGSVFLFYGERISNLIYGRENIGSILSMLSITCVFLYLQQTLVGTLNGLGRQGISLRNSILGYVIRIGFVYFCIPVYGINGYIWGIAISFGLVSILNLAEVVKRTGLSVDIRNWITKPGIAVLVMPFVSKYTDSFFEIFNLGYRYTSVLQILGGVAAACCLMFITGVFDIRDLFNLTGLKKKRILKK
jgi:stage V sporulation protein B